MKIPDSFVEILAKEWDKLPSFVKAGIILLVALEGLILFVLKKETEDLLLRLYPSQAQEALFVLVILILPLFSFVIPLLIAMLRRKTGGKKLESKLPSGQKHLENKGTGIGSSARASSADVSLPKPVESSAPQLYLRPYFEPISTAQPKETISNLIHLIESNSSVNTIRDFLNENAYLLLKITPRRSLFVVSQPRLGDDHLIDFGLYGESNTNWWNFIELEQPDNPLFDESGDPSAYLVHSLRQTQDWKRWITENKGWTAKFGDTIPPMLIPLVIMGRRQTLSDEDRERLKNFDFVYTYDSLIESAKDFLNMRPEALVQKRAIPWEDFKKILQKKRLHNLWGEIEKITGEMVYMHKESFVSQFTESELSSTLSVRDHLSPNELGQEAIKLCNSFVEGSHIAMPTDGKLAQLLLFLHELNSIPWSEGVDAPKQELATFERASKAWQPQVMAKEISLGVLDKELEKTFGQMLDDIKMAVKDAVSSTSIRHHTAIQTCVWFALSLLVPGWCPEEANLLSAMISIYRKGAIVVSNLVVGKDRQNLAISPIVW